MKGYEGPRPHMPLKWWVNKWDLDQHEIDAAVDVSRQINAYRKHVDSRHMGGEGWTGQAPDELLTELLPDISEKRHREILMVALEFSDYAHTDRTIHVRKGAQQVTYTDDDLIEYFANLALRLGRTPSAKDIAVHDGPGKQVYYTRLGTMNEVAEMLGLEPNTHANSREPNPLTDEFLEHWGQQDEAA